ncbi:MAG: hypothetical protein HY295_02860, partial [Thaumarchaeota archaeon]|nr:hypothetical protein [Nitrososphaerota archaeon]
MEKKLSGILLSRDCYLWTNIGLKSIEEIQQDDVILGLDRKANIISYKVKKNPSPFGPQKLVNLITTYGNIALPGESELYTPYGPKKAEKIEIDDHIEMIPFSICEAIRNSIVKDGVDVNEILNNEIAYLLARARIRDKTGRTHFKIRNKNEMEKIGKLLLSAQKLLNGKIILKSND